MASAGLAILKRDVAASILQKMEVRSHAEPHKPQQTECLSLAACHAKIFGHPDAVSCYLPLMRFPFWEVEVSVGVFFQEAPATPAEPFQTEFTGFSPQGASRSRNTC